MRFIKIPNLGAKTLAGAIGSAVLGGAGGVGSGFAGVATSVIPGEVARKYGADLIGSCKAQKGWIGGLASTGAIAGLGFGASVPFGSLAAVPVVIPGVVVIVGSNWLLLKRCDELLADFAKAAIEEEKLQGQGAKEEELRSLVEEGLKRRQEAEEKETVKLEEDRRRRQKEFEIWRNWKDAKNGELGCL